MTKNRLNPLPGFGRPICAMLLAGSMLLQQAEAARYLPPSGKMEATRIEEKVLKGKVLDDKNVALPGVSVVVKGTSTGTITNPEGNFELKVEDQAARLVFSFIGYQTKEVEIGNQSNFNVTLDTDSKELTEVVVVGYGSQRKGDVTSSVVRVTQENFVKTPALDAGQLLQGKVAGLTISAPSGDPTQGTQILLRGNTTLLGANSNPLVLIDGVPGDLKTVAPEDIESIDVLKDGSAAAIYGTRGTNGVIIVTTKRASGNYSSGVEYNTSFSSQTLRASLNCLRLRITATTLRGASGKRHGTLVQTRTG